MPDISAAAVAALRARTGVSILQCKKALEEAGGDEEKAIEILRKKGQAQAVKSAGREQFEGAIFIAEDEKKAALVQLKCETDFVARGDDFVAFGQSLADTLLSKGEAAAKKIAEDSLPDIVQKLGENISLGETLIVDAPVIGSYVHSNRKIGVIVGLGAGATTQAKDAAMHAAAMNPLYVKPEEVTDDRVEKEKEVWREQLKKEGKPEAIWDKIMMGKEKKFREENALVSQPFVKDPSKTVGQHIAPATVEKFVRVAF
jgi:elongation factor Ts